MNENEDTPLQKRKFLRIRPKTAPVKKIQLKQQPNNYCNKSEAACRRLFQHRMAGDQNLGCDMNMKPFEYPAETQKPCPQTHRSCVKKSESIFNKTPPAHPDRLPFKLDTLNFAYVETRKETLGAKQLEKRMAAYKKPYTRPTCVKINTFEKPAERQPAFHRNAEPIADQDLLLKKMESIHLDQDPKN